MNIKLVYCENTEGYARGWLPDDFNPIDDIGVEHLKSKEELLDVLLEIAGYDYEEFNTENENMTIDEKIVEALSAFDDISSGSPYILYIGIDGKPTYEDDIELQRPDDLQQFNFEGYIDDHELKKRVAEVIYGDDWPSEDDEELSEDDEELEESFKSKDKHSPLREDVNIKPKDFYVIFKGDKSFYDQAANILYDWYEAEGDFEDFNSKKKFLDFVKGDIYDMLDAADSKEDVITVEKAMGIYDPEEWEESEELDEQGEDDEGYEPQLTTDPMHAGQWYESLHEEKDRYSVLREALDRLDGKYNKGKGKVSTSVLEYLTTKRYSMSNGGKKSK